jgi:hypothetical protein
MVGGVKVQGGDWQDLFYRVNEELALMSRFKTNPTTQLVGFPR